SKITKVTLARDDCGNARKARRENTQDIAIEAEGMDETDSPCVEISRKLPDGSQERKRLEGAPTAAPRSNAGRLELRAQRAFGTHATHVHVPLRSIQSRGELDKLP